MPGFDGTGPRGLGSLSGRGRGFCVLKVGQDSGEQISGYAGLNGKPLAGMPGKQLPELEYLHEQAQLIEKALHQIQFRIAFLEKDLKR